LLLVGEGDSEEIFLRHLKAIYINRNCGVSVIIKNARGKGASHVVDVAIRASHGAAFDKKVALLDTDEGWDTRTQAKAKKAKITVLPSVPCLEASLLLAHGRPTEGLTSEQLKREFHAAFGSSATNLSIYKVHFDRLRLETAAPSVSLISSLVNLLSLPW
jgi:hypothetical protein